MILNARPFLAVVTVTLASGLLGACSDYMDRKNTIAFSAGEAVQTNVITQVPDPWPPHSMNKNIAFNGERMQRAVEAYRCGPRNNAGNGGSAGNGGGLGNSVSVNINNGPPSSTSGSGQPSDC